MWLTRNIHISTKWHVFWSRALFVTVYVCGCTDICSFYLGVLKFFPLPLVPICPLPTLPSSPLMLLCCLSRLEPEILLRAKQDFMKIDSAADLEWVSFPAVQHVRAGLFAPLQSATNLISGLFWSVLDTFSLDSCPIREFFARFDSFSPEVLAEMMRAPSAGDLVNVHRCLYLTVSAVKGLDHFNLLATWLIYMIEFFMTH